MTDVPKAEEVGVGRRKSWLLLQQRWVIRLRWVAGLGITIGGVANHFALKWYPAASVAIIVTGLILLAFNLTLWSMVSHGLRVPGALSKTKIYALIWVQILMDLACLTGLNVWTGGATSPLRGFYVFHMVFASLLLPPAMAYAIAGITILMMEIMLHTGSTKLSGGSTQLDAVYAVGWDVTILAVVYLTSTITVSLRRHRRKLMRQNRRVRMMTQRIKRQHETLVQSEKMVALGQMAAGVAHEVANPLASMDGLLQLLERRPERATGENIGKLREQIARINQIVRHLTTFAHPDKGEWETGTLNDVVQHALDVLRFDQRLKKVTIEQHLTPDPPMVNMQRRALEQVFINLVINALDAMEKTENPTIVVRTQMTECEALLEVTDNGEGIPQELHTRIFEPFFTTKSVGKGTGLGLSLSYSFVRKHGGDIRVTSSPGQGATFRITLPLHPSRRREEAAGVVSSPEKSPQ